MEAIAAINSQLTLAPKWPEIRPQTLNFHSYTTLISRNKTTPLILAHCTQNPNADKQSPVDGHCRSSDSPKNPQLQSQPISPNLSSTTGLVFDLGAGDSWDNLEIGSPVVKRFLSDDEERWCMWYHGRSRENPAFDSIGLAVSGNGIHWERGGQGVRRNADVGLVMSRSDNWWAFDTHGVRPSEVMVMSSNKVRSVAGVYWMYYTGYFPASVDDSGDRSGLNFCNPDMALPGDANSDMLNSLPGLAISQDGRHWARIEGEHHTGALLDVGDDGEWDSLFLASPQVIFHGAGDLRMYYHAYDAENGEFAIGLARSRDGMRWLKLGKVLGAGGKGAFDERGAMNPRVVRNRENGEYVMVYEGVGVDGRRAIGMAASADGLKGWRRAPEGPVLESSGDGGGWDCRGVGMPWLVGVGVGVGGESEEWRLYYRGIGEEGRTGIGLAVCHGSDFGSFRRWTGFHF
ncbi:uncharacterized protein LOC127261601 [Andrographis paniculata]|uniref:uncharacterized protein LOC127261601 n=1 Tax=Andrographis paniculata TaxID=175694 RepID=UPI0021E8CBDB|nr:uncharacterized protein LOC127261601 [Andrographis paniculata]